MSALIDDFQEKLGGGNDVVQAIDQGGAAINSGLPRNCGSGCGPAWCSSMRSASASVRAPSGSGRSLWTWNESGVAGRQIVSMQALLHCDARCCV
ncbi:hypothetical protein IMCC9480_1838 [Oxalobacteraceae bacterium IMCC9480]|nr:hypothetical protein IMCC9480_1838 [Oxalobacteraceae bacterium IMCC9480]